MRLVAPLVLALTLVACVPRSLDTMQAGTFVGTVDLRWLREDTFLFVPNDDAPFSFVRPNGETIRPGAMVTDGGSVPRLFWALDGYSPWAFAPAYIIHDWMYQARHCGFLPADRHSFEDTVVVFAEALASLMESDPRERDAEVFANLVAGAASPFARWHWDHGVCRRP